MCVCVCVCEQTHCCARTCRHCCRLMNRSSSYFWKTSTLTLQWYECAVSCVHVHMYLCPHMFVPLLSCVARLANAVRSLLFGFDLGCLVVSVAQAFPGQSHAHGVRTTTASKAEGKVTSKARAWMLRPAMQETLGGLIMARPPA